MRRRLLGAFGRRWWGRLLVFLLACAAWTLLSCYPNPAVLARNLARYRRLPIDVEVERRMGWELPAQPDQIELFVDSLLVPTPDWPLHRVPWYVPTASEVARSLHGDCEAKAVLFASLLAGKGLPFEVRASFNHIWVDYPGRPPRAGETRELAYLEGEPGRFRLHWPGEVAWREVLAAQRAQLWDAMPIARKAIWLLGLTWIALSLLLLRGPAPEEKMASRWRPRVGAYLGRAALIAALMLALVALAPSLRRDRQRVRWRRADLVEVVALAALAGAFLTWVGLPRSRPAVSVRDDRSGLRASRSSWLRRRSREVAAAEIASVALDASPGGLRPWVVSAIMRTGERVPLVYESDEVAGRKALRSLALALSRPMVVRWGAAETWTMPDEVHLSLRERAALRPDAALLPRPPGCGVEVQACDGGVVIRLPAPERRAGLKLLAFAAVPLVFLALTNLAVWRFPWQFLAWVSWIVAVSLVSLVSYLALILRAEIVAYLAGARIEVGEGALRYHSAGGKVETIDLDSIETVEMGRRGEAMTLAVVSADRVIHIAGFGVPEHRAWLRQAIERAIVEAGRRASDEQAS